MKQLRRTIRKILLENTQHIEKIVELLYTGEMANINQAVELAETMGYISNLEYSVSDAYYFPQDIHEWKFVGSEEFMYVILDYKVPRKVQGFSLMSPNFRDVTIKLYVNQ